MRIEEWQKVEELLDAALELAPADRGKFLDEAGLIDPELRREVASLLDCEENVDGFLASPALALASDFFDNDTGEERAGQIVGHYRILREIGRGGMGAVFLAERSDGEFQQQVALKVVRRSFADSELARRFRRERQILASLNHPNIARLLDGGVSADGEPFFAMEYVEGTRIDEYCELRDLSIRARLKLFLAVCRGVSYAHQHLVIHRDIKPSNILVTADDGVPKLLDFGIAKLLDTDAPDSRDVGHEHTRTGLRAFTPDYASPEQVTGAHVTTASDVYSLGVVLRDLLSGARSSTNSARAPGGWRSKSIGRTVPANLHTEQEYGEQESKTRNQRRLSVELENIIAMARREDPTRRYSSAAELAEDVQSFLDGRTVRAQKDSFTYRAGKFIRRNKITVGALALVALSLIVGLAVALWQANVARQERDRAERRFNDVRQLSNALLTDIAPKIERLQGSTEARRVLVNQSLKYLDSLAAESGDDAQLQSELAGAYEKVGDLQGAPRQPNLSDFKGAIASYEKAQAIRRRLLERNPNDPEGRRLLAANHAELSNIRFWVADIAGSLRESEAAQSLYEKLVAEQPGSAALRVALADTFIDHADILFNKQQFAATYPVLRSALTSVQEIRPADSSRETEVPRVMGKAYSLLGISLSWDGKQAEAEAETAKALAIFERLVETNPNDVILRHGLWVAYIRASSLYEDTNDALVESFALKALQIATETAERDPLNTQARQNLAQAHSRLAASYINLKRPDLAVIHAERSLSISADLERSEPESLTYKRHKGVVYTRLGEAKYNRRDLPGALDAFEKSVESFEKVVRADAGNTISLRDIAQACKDIGSIHDDLAGSASGQKRREHVQAARQNYQRALDILLQLKTQGAFAEVDQKLLEKMQNAVRKYE